MQRAWRRKWEKTKKIRTMLLQKAVVPLVAVTLIGTMAATASANPTGGVIRSGSGSITDSGDLVTVHQNSDKMSVNWDSFNIGAGEQVKFIQPGSNSIALNRVMGSDASSIFGTLTANGKVFLVNPNGILFAPGSSVNVAGLVASTSNISDQDFQSGSFAFAGGQGGAVINRGHISATNGGNVELLGSVVSNEGIITATAINNGKSGAVRLEGNRETGAVANSGSITTVAGNVVLQGAAVDNQGSITTASSGKNGQGSVSLLANEKVGTVLNNGNIKAGDQVTGNGATVINQGVIDTYNGADLYGNAISLTAGSKINARTYVSLYTGAYEAGNGSISIAPDTISTDFTDIYYKPTAYDDAATKSDRFGNPFTGLLPNTRVRAYMLVKNASDLQNVSTNLKGIYQLHSDIDMAGVNFQPIGNGSAFSGELYGHASNGKNYKISNLTIDSNASYVGLFGVTDGATIGGVSLNNVNITSTSTGANTATGALVGYAIGSYISGIDVGGIVKSSSQSIGGMIGRTSNSMILPNSVNGEIISSSSYSNVGGLIGRADNRNFLIYAHQSAKIGIVNVSGQSFSNVGGIVGLLHDSEAGSIATHEQSFITAKESSNIGGIVGLNSNGSVYDVTNNATIGVKDRSESGLYLTGSNVGGVIGSNSGGTAYEVYNRGAVNGGYGWHIGGIMGTHAYGMIEYSKNSGSVTGGADNSYLGGIVGSNYNGVIKVAVNTGAVVNTGNHVGIGGIAGTNWKDSNISESYNAGNVAGLGAVVSAGGITGSNGAGSIILNSYNLGTIEGGNSSYSSIGGLVGWQTYGTIINSYSSSLVRGDGASRTGALVGRVGASANIVQSAASGIFNSYFNTSLNGNMNAVGNVLQVSGAVGLSQEAMSQKRNFAGWDFYNVWQMDSVTKMPSLIEHPWL